MITRLACAMVLISMGPAMAWAQGDLEGSKDHPLVPRMTGYYIADYEFQEFSGHEFPLPNDKEQRVEGRLWRIIYYLKDGAKQASSLEIGRNYANAFRAKGGQVRFTTPDGVITVASLTQGGSEVWLHTTVAGNGSEYSVWCVERAGMTQQLELSAAAIAAALKDTGSLALRNILFDTGRATLRPESSKELDLVIEVLTADPGLRLEIQGHTDNVGQAAANRTLSGQRAAAVRDYLIRTGGISAARLTAVGFGDTQPVAPNTTDDGRAQNRRVVIVRK